MVSFLHNLIFVSDNPLANTPVYRYGCAGRDYECGYRYLKKITFCDNLPSLILFQIPIFTAEKNDNEKSESNHFVRFRLLDRYLNISRMFWYIFSNS